MSFKFTKITDGWKSRGRKEVTQLESARKESVSKEFMVTFYCKTMRHNHQSRTALKKSLGISEQSSSGQLLWKYL